MAIINEMSVVTEKEAPVPVVEEEGIDLQEEEKEGTKDDLPADASDSLSCISTASESDDNDSVVRCHSTEARRRLLEKELTVLKVLSPVKTQVHRNLHNSSCNEEDDKISGGEVTTNEPATATFSSTSEEEKDQEIDTSHCENTSDNASNGENTDSTRDTDSGEKPKITHRDRVQHRATHMNHLLRAQAIRHRIVPPSIDASAIGHIRFSQHRTYAGPPAKRVYKISTINPEVLSSLPHDIRQEVLLNQHRMGAEPSTATPEESQPDAGPNVEAPETSDLAASKDVKENTNQPEMQEHNDLVSESQTSMPETAINSQADSSGDSVVEKQKLRVEYSGSYDNDGKWHGHGKLSWSNGDEYIGSFAHGVRDGEGTFKFADGSQYVGSWKDDKFHGEGTRQFAEGGASYTGEYVEGVRSGQGKYRLPSGEVYIGGFKNGHFDGLGRVYYTNGRVFKGMFKLGVRDGRGETSRQDGGWDVYKYAENKKVGDGVRWNANRRKAWRLRDGKIKKISAKEAAAIDMKCSG